MKREVLINARKKLGFTQQEMADRIQITLGYYQKIEYGTRTGSFTLWDKLEKITGVHQSVLRAIYPGKEASR